MPEQYDHSAEILVGRYQVQRVLGKKAGRRTLLAVDRVTQEPVVVKLLLFGQDFEWDALTLFEREVNTLQSLSHPSIPRYLDSFEFDTAMGKGFALVQTYLSAQSLETVLQNGQTFGEAAVRELVIALLHILVDLQARQPPIVHRDIKPSNILIDEYSDHRIGQVYLVDFGSVQTLAAHEGGTLTIVGTYGYMPPEQFGGRAVPASDLYSLGATLIYVLTGRHPADLPQDNLRLQFEPVVQLPPAWQQWLRQMVEPSLDRRFQTAQEALTALEHLDSFAPLTIQQPAGSITRIHITPDTLEMHLPPIGFGGFSLALLLFTIAWNAFLVFWTMGVLAAPFPFSLLFGLFSLPFWGVGITMIVGVLATLFGVTKLQITPQQVALTYHLLGWKRHLTRPSQRHEVTHIEYGVGQVSGHETTRNLPTDAQTDRQHSGILRIWAGARCYEIHDQRLTPPELAWLAQTLGEWLGLPIKPL